MLDAINKTVISGTPRQISIKIVHKIETTGSFDLLPRANITPIGRDNTIPTPAIGAGEDEVMTISFPDFGIRFETDLYVFFNQATHVEVLYA